MIGKPAGLLTVYKSHLSDANNRYIRTLRNDNLHPEVSRVSKKAILRYCQYAKITYKLISRSISCMLDFLLNRIKVVCRYIETLTSLYIKVSVYSIFVLNTYMRILYRNVLTSIHSSNYLRKGYLLPTVSKH